MKNDKKNKVLIGLKKAHSSLGRIIKILDQDNQSGMDERCFSLIQQNLSVIGLLKSVNVAMLENHIDLYIKRTVKGVMSRKALKKMKEEIIKTVRQAQDK